MNFVTFGADTSSVRPAQDNYFVRLDVGPSETDPRLGTRPERPGPHDTPYHRRRRKRINSKSIFLTLVAVGLAAWLAWAVQQPGGVSGTVNGFIDHVRGTVQDASAGPDLDNAVKYYNSEYDRTSAYPQPSEDQLAAAGIGIDVDSVSCGTQVVVLRTLTVSRLLVAGVDRGEVAGRQGCPANLADPKPWKSK